PPRRLAHRHPTGRQLGLPPYQTPTHTLARVNSPAESISGQLQSSSRSSQPVPVSGSLASSCSTCRIAGSSSRGAELDTLRLSASDCDLSRKLAPLHWVWPRV